MWGVYTYRPPQKGVGPPVALVPMPGRRPLVCHFSAVAMERASKYSQKQTQK